MTYTPNDVVDYFKGRFKPKKVRRLMRSIYNQKDKKRWSLSPQEYNECIEYIKEKEGVKIND
ncbi:MAG: hypothetical protein ACRCR2_08015 [Fusobacteriaceae bacterium]